MARRGATAVQIWFGFGLAWSKGGTDLVQVGFGLVQRWFRFGSGLARLGAKVVQIWFIFGSDLVQVWLGLGQSRFGFGSGLDQLWFRVDSALVRCDSCLVRCDSYLVNSNMWFRFGSDLAPIWWWGGHGHLHTRDYMHTCLLAPKLHAQRGVVIIYLFCKSLFGSEFHLCQRGRWS